MGYDFEREDGAEWGINSPGWRLLRHLAERFGWQPAGTLPPEEQDWISAYRDYLGDPGWQPPAGTLPPEEQDAGQPWPGEYTGNGGQRVTAADAAGLAAGLRAAVASPEFDGLVAAFETDFRGQLAAASTPTVTLIAGPFRFRLGWLSRLLRASTPTVTLTTEPFPPDEWRQAALEFAAFCEGGGFRIH